VITKQLEAEGFDGVSRGTIENWRRRDKWDGWGGVEAIKAVAKQIRIATPSWSSGRNMGDGPSSGGG
jgi:hypothetical protein